MSRLRLSCQEQLLPGQRLEEKFEFAVAAGFDGIELRGRGQYALAERLPLLRAALRAGVVLPTVCVEMSHFVGAFDPELRRDAVDQLKSQLTVAAELGGIGVMTPAAWGMFSRRLPPFEPPRDQREDRAVLVDSFGELAEHAAAAGVLILLEPLNRYEDHMVNRLEQAVELCRAVGVASMRVAGDFYHMNIEEDDISASLTAAAPYLAHLQASDSNRLQPGAGHLDWRSALATLDTDGYQGWIAYECRLRGTAEQALPASVAFLRGQR